jgi:hypothetical protein
MTARASASIEGSAVTISGVVSNIFIRFSEPPGVAD